MPPGSKHCGIYTLRNDRQVRVVNPDTSHTDLEYVPDLKKMKTWTPPKAEKIENK
jgi:hypothetical protein